MRVTPQHVALIAETIDPLDTPERRERYRAGDFPRSAAVRDLDKRYRWDLLYAGNGVNGGLIDTLGNAGYLDSHLDTALRQVVRPL